MMSSQTAVTLNHNISLKLVFNLIETSQSSVDISAIHLLLFSVSLIMLCSIYLLFPCSSQPIVTANLVICPVLRAISRIALKLGEQACLLKLMFEDPKKREKD